MQNITKDDIEHAVKELHDALIESLDAKQAVKDSYLREQISQKRLSLARDEIRALNI